jgi:hypothetical protein
MLRYVHDEAKVWPTTSKLCIRREQYFVSRVFKFSCIEEDLSVSAKQTATRMFLWYFNNKTYTMRDLNLQLCSFNLGSSNNGTSEDDNACNLLDCTLRGDKGNRQIRGHN